jgi:hypothetical protein
MSQRDDCILSQRYSLSLPQKMCQFDRDPYVDTTSNKIEDWPVSPQKTELSCALVDSREPKRAPQR